MRKYIRIGVDSPQNCFQVHALESEDCSATKRRLSRSGIVKSGRDFDAWLGATAKRKSTGGKEKFGSITSPNPGHRTRKENAGSRVW